MAKDDDQPDRRASALSEEERRKRALALEPGDRAALGAVAGSPSSSSAAPARARSSISARSRRWSSASAGASATCACSAAPFAEAVTKAHRADAVTIANTGMILVREGPRSDPKTALGKALLAHELTHVSQAQRGLHFALEGGESQGAPHEQEAEAVESQVHAEETGAGQAGGGKGGGGGVDKRAVIARVIELVEDWDRTQAERQRPPLGAPGMAEVVESREQLQHLARDGALRGHTYRDLQATGLRVPAGDFAGATFERCTLGGADFGGADFSRVTLTRVDFRRAQMAEALVVQRHRRRLAI